MTTATTTPDERLLRAAANANPADAHARLILAECLQEQGRDREAAVERIVAQPWCDEWRLQLADVAEREGNATYAEFVRVQVELGRLPEEVTGTGFIAACQGDYEGRAVRDVNPARERLQRRLLELSSRGHEAAFRRGPKCGACEGIGFGAAGLGGYTSGARCVHCDGTGDVGGLLERFDTQDDRYMGGRYRSGPTNWFYRADWRRGCPERVECRLADVIERHDVKCRGCNGTGTVRFADAAGDMDDRECSDCRGKKTVRGSRVTQWAKRVVRWHAVLELWPTDCVPLDGGAWSRNDVRGMDEPGFRSAWRLPRVAWDALDGFEELGTGISVTDGPNLKGYADLEAARTALATALARLARGSLLEDV